MIISIGSDHAGFEYKAMLIAAFSERYAVIDKGTGSTASCDYPEYAHAVAKSVASGESDYGILICGSANGVAITANKHTGIRAAIAWLPELASLARLHNNANVLCLPARFVSKEVATECAETFLHTAFEGGRHQRRVDMIDLQ